MPEYSNIVINGWTIFAHPLFLDEIDTLIEQVEKFKSKDPTLPDYRQGSTLGDEHKHWFRAKFFQQYRLFFRFDSASKIIVYSWVNDEKNKRAYGNKTDTYRVFEKMQTAGIHLTIGPVTERSQRRSGPIKRTIQKAHGLSPSAASHQAQYHPFDAQLVSRTIPANA